MRAWLTGVLLVVAVGSAAQGAPASQVRLFGHRITEDPTHPKWSKGLYVLPNEEQPYRFDRVVAGRAQRGDILAVGTFRGLHVGAAAGVGDAGIRPDAKTYLLDVDAGIQRYNHALIRLIDDEPRRVRFLERAPKELLPSLSVERYAGLGQGRDGTRTLFGSDTRYAQVYRGVKRGAYVPIRGSIAGGQAIRELGDALRRTGRQLAVLDVSNALDYLYEPGAMDAFVATLRGLPLAADALLLLTNERTARIRYAVNGSWEYHALRVADFVSAYERRAPGMIGDGFHLSLFEHAFANDARVSVENDAIEPPSGFSASYPPALRN